MKLGSGTCILRPPSALLIAVAPLAVYLVSEQLLRSFGLNFGTVREFSFVKFEHHLAEAARLSSLGAFFLIAAAAAAAFAYFVYTLRLLRTPSLYLVGGAFVASVVVMSLTVLPKEGPQETAFSSSALICTALSYGAQTKQPEEAGPPPRFRIPDARRNGRCEAAGYTQLRSLLKWNQIAVLLGLASLIFGSICCLAGPDGDEPDPARADAGTAGPGKTASDEKAAKDRLTHWEEQSDRLNAYLYVSAILLVAGLMFVSAILKWPSFAVASAAYETHVNALTAYYGFTYTVLLGSFYVPVAVSLSARVRKLKPEAASTDKVPEAFKGPLQLLKIAAALFSTTMVPIVASLLSLG
jgi:hypothetical protein